MRSPSLFIRSHQSFLLPMFVALIFAPLGLDTFAQGTTTKIAVSGDQAPGTPSGAVFEDFSSHVALNKAGQVVYIGFLSMGGGGVNLDNFSGIWRNSELLARMGRQAGGTTLGTVFEEFRDPIINDLGQTAYKAFLTHGLPNVNGNNDSGIWRNTLLVAREGEQAGDTPAGTLFDTFENDPAINHAGQTVYRATLKTAGGGVDTTNDSGIWRDATLIAREGSLASDVPSSALFDHFDSGSSNPVINSVGQTAYRADLRIGSGDVVATNDSGIWRDFTLIAREGSEAPGTSGAEFSGFTDPNINDSGQTSFFALLRTGTGNTDDTNNTGIWRDSTLIAREGVQAPGTPQGAVFDFFTNPLFNNRGQTAFRAFLRQGPGDVNNTNRVGIWRDSTLVARSGNPAPGTSDGLFSSLGEFALNDAGQVAFTASLSTRSGGVDDTNNRGIWIAGTNNQALLVVREGDVLDGKTVSELDYTGESGGSDGRARGLNDFSQIAYRATFTNGDSGVFLFTPQIHWTRSNSGGWDTSSNWTIGQLPGDPHDVFIDPAGSLTVLGPSGAVTMTNLTIGGNNGIATLSLNGGSINTPNALAVTATGVLTGDGVIDGSVSNEGVVAADNVTITGVLLNNNLVNFTSGRLAVLDELENHGIITGSGMILGQLNNTAAGEVRVSTGEHLIFAEGMGTNTGNIQITGGQLEFKQNLNSFSDIDVVNGTLRVNGVMNNASEGGSNGRMFVRNATLRFGGLINKRFLGVSFGTTDVFGMVENSVNGDIVVSGNANISFYDDVNNLGTIQVATGSTAVYFGTVSGSGSFTGSGTNFFEGTFSPGNSPGKVIIESDAVLGADATLVMELAGTALGQAYDHLTVGGDFMVDGSLDVQLLHGFSPRLGDAFDLLDFASISGSFDAVALPTLTNGLSFDTSALFTNGVITVVPEPSSTFFALTAFLIIARSTRRQGQTRFG